MFPGRLLKGSKLQNMPLLKMKGSKPWFLQTKRGINITLCFKGLCHGTKPRTSNLLKPQGAELSC